MTPNSILSTLNHLQGCLCREKGSLLQAKEKEISRRKLILCGSVILNMFLKASYERKTLKFEVTVEKVESQARLKYGPGLLWATVIS